MDIADFCDTELYTTCYRSGCLQQALNSDFGYELSSAINLNENNDDGQWIDLRLRNWQCQSLHSHWSKEVQTSSHDSLQTTRLQAETKLPNKLTGDLINRLQLRRFFSKLRANVQKPKADQLQLVLELRAH